MGEPGTDPPAADEWKTKIREGRPYTHTTTSQLRPEAHSRPLEVDQAQGKAGTRYKGRSKSTPSTRKFKAQGALGSKAQTCPPSLAPDPAQEGTEPVRNTPEVHGNGTCTRLHVPTRRATTGLLGGFFRVKKHQTRRLPSSASNRQAIARGAIHAINKESLHVLLSCQ